MAWETRRGQRYYYCKRRQGQRVVSEYIGTGSFADILAEIAEGRRRERIYECGQEEDARRRVGAQDAAADAITEMVSTLSTATLLVAGCRTHRGQWRRQRWATREATR